MSQKDGEDEGPRRDGKLGDIYRERGKLKESQEPEIFKRWTEMGEGARDPERVGEREVLWRMGIGGERVPLRELLRLRSGGGWEPAQPSGFTALGICRLVQGDTSFLPIPIWASAHSPGLGDQFSNKLDPRGGNKWPSQLQLAASSKYFSLAQGSYLSGCFLDHFEGQLGLCSSLCAISGPAWCGGERDGLCVIPGNGSAVDLSILP